MSNPAADGTVRLPPDSTGKRLDTVEVTRDDDTVVERQRVVLGGDDPEGRYVAPVGEKGHATLPVTSADVVVALVRIESLLEQILEALS